MLRRWCQYPGIKNREDSRARHMKGPNHRGIKPLPQATKQTVQQQLKGEKLKIVDYTYLLSVCGVLVSRVWKTVVMTMTCRETGVNSDGMSEKGQLSH